MPFLNSSAIALSVVFSVLPIHLPQLSSSAAIAQTQPSPSDRRTRALQLFVQADSLRSVGLPEVGDALQEEGLQMLQEMGERLKEAEILVGIGNTRRLSGQLQEALSFYQRALAIYQGPIISPIDRYQQLERAYETANTIGRVYQALGQYDQALAAYQQAIALAHRASSDFVPPEVLTNIGTLHHLAGRPEQALAAYQQALPHYQPIRAYSTQFMNQLGLLYQSQGQFESALAAYQEGLAALEERDPGIQRLIDRVLTLENISSLYQAQGQTVQAETYAQQALDASLGPTGYRDDIGVGANEAQRANILQEIGSFYLAEGQLDRAKSYFDRSLAIAASGSHDSYTETNILNSIEISYRQLGLIEQTIPYQQRRAEVYRNMGISLEASTALRILGETYQRLEQWEPALATYQQAMSSFERFYEEYDMRDSETDKIRFQMGTIYQAQGKPEQALTTYQQVLAAAQASSNRELQAQVLQQIGRLYEAQEQMDQAQPFYQQAADLREQIIAELQSLPMPTVYW
ncbi:MAG TPA: tetratricopeptide repeat protein [Crinalium sp.]|jgi:tetratricopeptide (TPR) repeat protein